VNRPKSASARSAPPRDDLAIGHTGRVAHGSSDPLGASLRRAPYVWLLATVLLYLVAISALAGVAKDDRHASTGIAIVGASLIAYAAVASFLLTRVVARRSRILMTRDRVASIRWACAVSAFLIGFAAVAVGGKQWALALGTAVSAVLLVLTARALRRTESSS
jgi:hypothetical protein